MARSTAGGPTVDDFADGGAAGATALAAAFVAPAGGCARLRAAAGVAAWPAPVPPPPPRCRGPPPTRAPASAAGWPGPRAPATCSTCPPRRGRRRGRSVRRSTATAHRPATGRCRCIRCPGSAAPPPRRRWPRAVPASPRGRWPPYQRWLAPVRRPRAPPIPGSAPPRSGLSPTAPVHRAPSPPTRPARRRRTAGDGAGQRWP